jgi:hypothetical protein
MSKSISSLSQSLTGNLQEHLTSQDNAEARELKAIIESVPEKVELYDSAFSYIVGFFALVIALSLAVAAALPGKQHSVGLLMLMLAGAGMALFFAWSRFRSSRTPFATLTRTHLRVRNAASDLPLTAIDHFDVLSQTVTWLFPSTYSVTMSLFLKDNSEAPQLIRCYNSMYSHAGWNAKRKNFHINSGGIVVKGQRGGTDAFIELFARYLEVAAAAEELAKRQRQDWAALQGGDWTAHGTKSGRHDPMLSPSDEFFPKTAFAAVAFVCERKPQNFADRFRFVLQIIGILDGRILSENENIVKLL